jgi:tetratricopeptide (TPR) repeat protein/O-antigen ligase
MSTPGPSTGGEKAAHLLTLASSVFLCGALLWPALASGAHQGWPLTLTQLLVLAALLCWVLDMLIARRLEWRPTALDLPMLLLAALICLQLIIGNGALARWALAAPPGDPAQAAALPTPFFSIGTVSGAQTAESLLIFLTYAAVYVLVVNLVRRRSQLDRLVQTLLLFGGALAFVALIDYLARDSWLLWWREGPRLARLTGPFVNPDHFATWLVMLTCLGVGYVAARRASGRPDLRWRVMLRSRAEREAAIRRDLPAVGVALTLLAALFTLSRGALLSLAVALLAALAVRKRTSRIGGWTLLVGALAAMTIGGAVWIGLDPLVARLGETDHVKRWLQWTSTLPMFGAFPLFGVGLGAYKDIFFHYQPAALEPGRVYFPYAHNDLLQFVVETGPLGAALLGFAIWRVGRDLVGAHLLGQGSCPVGGGAGRDAQRHHAFSVTIALGALAAVFAVMIHSLLDFSARIPADGILAAACLGIATVALHTRFTAQGDEDLSPVRARALTGRIVPLGAVAALATLALAWVAARPALVETRLAAVTGAGALARADRAVGVDARNIRARRMRAELRLDAAREIWRKAPSDEAARARAADLVAGAVEDLRTAIRLRPTEPFLHERLAVASATAAVLEPVRAIEHRARSLSHLARAIALAPENPLLYLTEAVVAVSGPGARLELGLAAAREAVRRDPALLPELVDRFLPLRLSPAQWLNAIPVSTVDRLQLGDLLEQRGVLEEAGEIYSRAVEMAAGPEAPLAHWTLARLLLRIGNFQTAARQAEAGLARDPDNPELLLTRADALSGLSSPSALGAYEGALRAAEAQDVKGAHEPFGALIENARLRGLVAQRLGGSPRTQPLRYRRALARYLTDQRMWSPSLVEWERVLAQSPDDAVGHFSRGLALDAFGNPDQAIDEYRKAVSLDDHNSAYRRRLAQRLWDTEQFYQAINEWRSLAGLQPANIETRLSLARAFVRVGERSEASREYEQILALAPGHPEARQALGRLRHTP